jgi:hypothetical protein
MGHVAIFKLKQSSHGRIPSRPFPLAMLFCNILANGYKTSSKSIRPNPIGWSEASLAIFVLFNAPQTKIWKGRTENKRYVCSMYFSKGCSPLTSNSWDAMMLL